VVSSRGAGWPPLCLRTRVSCERTRLITHVPLCALFLPSGSGEWNREAEIPADKAEISWRWDGTAATVDRELRSLVTRKWPDESPFRRLNEVYDACVDVDTREALGNAPLQPFLERIDSVETVEDLRLLFLELMLQGPLPFHVEVTQGFRDKTTNSLFLSPAGLSMPDAGWYPVILPESKAATLGSSMYTVEDHEDGQQHLLGFFRTLNELAGSSPEEADLIANQTFALETQLAEWRLGSPVVTDPLGPQLMSVSDLVELCPSVPWREAFEAIAESCANFNYTCNERLLADDKLIVVTNEKFFVSLDAALSNETMLNTLWKPLLRTHFIAMSAGILTKDFEEAGRKLSAWAVGTPDLPSREKLCTDSTVRLVGALADIAFMETFFPPKAQVAGWDLLRHIKRAFHQELATVEWMDEETRAKALDKAEKLQLNLGGSSKYKILSYPVSNESFFNISVAAARCKVVRNFMELGESPTSETWSLPSHTVNSWYTGGLNALFIPAGIMQEPFFSPEVCSMPACTKTEALSASNTCGSICSRCVCVCSIRRSRILGLWAC